jgi:hypothetical protein
VRLHVTPVSVRRPSQPPRRGRQRDPAQRDTVYSIEEVYGTDYGDVIRGVEYGGPDGRHGDRCGGFEERHGCQS